MKRLLTRLGFLPSIQSGSSEVFSTNGEIFMSYITLDIKVNQYKPLIAYVDTSYNTVDSRKVTWLSSNSNVATVVHGAIKGISEGTCEIRARLSDGKYAKCIVIVGAESQWVTINPEDKWTLDLVTYNIDNTGVEYINTTIGIQNALDYASGAGFLQVDFPDGTYSINETKTIILPSNLTVNLGNAIVKVNNNNFVTVDSVDTGTDIITKTGHGLEIGSVIVFGSDTPSDPLLNQPAGAPKTNLYYAIKVDDNSFRVADTLAHANSNTYIDITTTGTNVKYCVRNYLMFTFGEGENQCQNTRIINGTLQGDNDTRDFTNIALPHENNDAVEFFNCDNCHLDNINIIDFPGFTTIVSRGYQAYSPQASISKDNLESGSVDSSGNKVVDTTKIRTITKMNLSHLTAGNYQVWNWTGYGLNVYMTTRIYDIVFYNSSDEFIEKYTWQTYARNYKLPMGAAYAHIIYHQADVPTNGNTDFNNAVQFINNYEGQIDSSVMNCTYDGNRTTAIACSARDFQILGNTFRNTGLGSPGCDIDCEDGWDAMCDIVMYNNVFESPKAIILADGNGITLINNTVKGTIYVWDGSRDYKIIQNDFIDIPEGGFCEFDFRLSDPILFENTYINCISWKSVNTYDGVVPNWLRSINETFEDTPLLANVTYPLTNTSPNILIENGELYQNIKSSTGLTTKGLMRNCNIHDCSNIGVISGGTFEDCTFNNVSGSMRDAIVITGGVITSFTLYTNSGTALNLTIQSCANITNLELQTSTWATKTDVINILNNVINNSKRLLNLSLGKSGGILLQGNTITNTSSTQSLIHITDSTYSVPAADITFRNNNITQNNKANVVSGVAVASGTTTVTYGGNTLNNDLVPLDSIYNPNAYITVIDEDA